MKKLILSLLLLTAGCMTGPSQPASDALSAAQKGAVYKYDMTGTVNGTPFDGIGVIPYADKYQIQLVSRVDVDLLTITSCHRDFAAESVIDVNWFHSKRGYNYAYEPSAGIENSGSCLVRIGTYNRDKGQNSWGIIDFETPESTLPATNYCNGSTQQTNGVSICQSKVGLVQRITFDVPVRTAASALEPKCHFISQDQKTWEYELPAGECVISFHEIDPPYRTHRHSTIAYTDILIRGNQ